MPDLGAHAVEVTLAYLGSIVMIVLLVAISVAQARRSKQALAETERRANDA